MDGRRRDARRRDRTDAEITGDRQSTVYVSIEQISRSGLTHL
jgi:hypothetical protein